MSTKSWVLRVIFYTPERVDVEPPSVADSLRECAMASPRAWRAAVDAEVVDADVVDADEVDDIEDKVVKVFFSELSE
jgi:hypothetical protein